ncbi:MAG TPA: hypothetical protein VF174_11485 [Micromonosporaceae bacterium]
MTRFTIRIPAGPHTRFTEQVAQSMIGQRPQLNARASEDGPVLADYGRGVVVAAEPVNDGAEILLTIESEASLFE